MRQRWWLGVFLGVTSTMYEADARACTCPTASIQELVEAADVIVEGFVAESPDVCSSTCAYGEGAFESRYIAVLVDVTRVHRGTAYETQVLAQMFQPCSDLPLSEEPSLFLLGGAGVLSYSCRGQLFGDDIALALSFLDGGVDAGYAPEPGQSPGFECEGGNADAGAPDRCLDAGFPVDGGTDDAGDAGDAGTGVDSGFGLTDAGEGSDDAGVADAGAGDGGQGEHPDAGDSADAGGVADSGLGADAGIAFDAGSVSDAGEAGDVSVIVDSGCDDCSVDGSDAGELVDPDPPVPVEGPPSCGSCAATPAEPVAGLLLLALITLRAKRRSDCRRPTP